MKFFIKSYFILITACLTLCTACDDEILPVDEVLAEEQGLPSDAIMLNGFDQEFILPVDGGVVSRICVEEGDFLTPLNDATLYIEQNDGGQYRVAQVTVEFTDGSSNRYTLAQASVSRSSATDVSRNFYRHHGVGYSYDAVGGEYCNLGDVRCQVLNRAVLDRLEDMVVDQLLTVDYVNTMSVSNSVSTSVVDYVQNANFYGSVSGGILIFSGSASKTCSIFEDGEIDTYILHNEETLSRAKYYLDPVAICRYIETYPTLLTSSFREAIKRLASSSKEDWRAIDEFIATYGTHLITYVELGAKLTVDVQVETHKFNTIEQEKALSEAAIATLFKKNTSSTSYQSDYKILRNSRCRIDILGGDVSAMDAAISTTLFGNEKMTLSMLSDWERSVKFDDDNLNNSNVELINMKVAPIWELIPNSDVALRVETRIMGNASLMQQLLGNRNFINTSFAARPSSVTCRIGNNKNVKYNNPDIVDIIAANRHVAIVCNEYVPDISKTTKVHVAYPVYEGRAKLSNGLCISGNQAYHVDWRHNRYTVTPLGTVEGDGKTIYMNGGVLSAKGYENMGYQTSHPILGCERPGGIKTDGSLGGEMRKVKKHFGHFYLDNATKYDNLPGWEYTTTDPVEKSNYADFFKTESYKNRMTRRDDYIYIYNTTEIGYE